MSIYLLIAVLLLVELLSFLALKSLSVGGTKGIRGWLAYWVWTAFIITAVLFMILYRDRFSEPKLMNSAFVLLGFFLMNLIPKLILSFFFILNQVLKKLENVFAVNSKKTETESRRNFITKMGLAVASVPFFGLFYGMWRGRYQFTVHEQVISLKNLPDSFVGKKIVQLSDMHLGSFPLGEQAVAKGIEKVNSLEPDYILFTGDMINERALEAEPWVDTIKKLKAKYKKYSVLGNHDYGDYYEAWAGKPDKIEANVQRLQQLEKEMGFQLLRNENVLLKQGEETIRLIGLENWGAGRFSKYGDLKKAMQGVQKEEVKILLSHDPSHWDAEVLEKTSIDLTLAGHTHGSQIGVELPGLKWSPVQYEYPRWAGLYEENGQQLYVNRGFGYIGYAGRIGIWPEITLFILQKA